MCNIVLIPKDIRLTRLLLHVNRSVINVSYVMRLISHMNARFASMNTKRCQYCGSNFLEKIIVFLPERNQPDNLVMLYANLNHYCYSCL